MTGPDPQARDSLKPPRAAVMVKPDLVAQVLIEDTFVAQEDQVSHARHAVRNVLDHHPEFCLSDVLWLLSELATNVVVHTPSPSFTVRVARTVHNALQVTVTDAGGSPTMPHITAPSEDGETGRGVAIVDCVAARWGTTRQAGRSAVWFEVERAALTSA